MSSTPAGARATPPGMLPTIDLDRIGVGRRHVAALLEIDVTRARRWIRQSNRGGQSTVTFLAWLVKTIAASLARDGHPTRRAAVPDGTDLTVMVERRVEGRKVVVPLLITGAETRDVTDIEAEIQRARTEPVSVASLLTDRWTPLARRLFTGLPQRLRRALTDQMLAGRSRSGSRSAGIVITSVGMGGRVKGWFIPRSARPLCIGIGAVTPKAVVLNGTIEAREVLHMTVVADHTAIDGAPASRWISSLVRAMETGREVSIN